jgi:small subunit ribosomal protein S17
MATGSSKRQLSGVVLPSKMDKTAVVEVTRKFPHPIYQKLIKKSKKYYAHDENNICNSGDLVKIIESRPTSKLKKWRVLSIETKATEL